MMLIVSIILTNFIRYKNLTKIRKKNPAEPGSNSQGERQQLYVSNARVPSTAHLTHTKEMHLAVPNRLEFRVYAGLEGM